MQSPSRAITRARRDDTARALVLPTSALFAGVDDKTAMPVGFAEGTTLAFTMDQRWPGKDHNIGKFRLVGENNSVLYQGSDDYVYVGQLSGCSGMTDTDIESAYNR